MQQQKSVLNRLDRIEVALGISLDGLERFRDSHDLTEDDDYGKPDPLGEVWGSIVQLRSITQPKQDDIIWTRPIVKQLWNTWVLPRSLRLGSDFRLASSKISHFYTF